MDTSQNQSATQQVKDALADGELAMILTSMQTFSSTGVANAPYQTGPVGQAVQNEAGKTSSDFKDLEASKKTPQQPAATGQPLTRILNPFQEFQSMNAYNALSRVPLHVLSPAERQCKPNLISKHADPTAVEEPACNRRHLCHLPYRHLRFAISAHSRMDIPCPVHHSRQ
jgi:hypothetical protein